MDVDSYKVFELARLLTKALLMTAILVYVIYSNIPKDEDE